MSRSRVILIMIMWVLCLVPLVSGGCSAQEGETGGFTAAGVGKVAIVGGTLIDGTGREPVENVAVVIEGERIREVLTDGSKYEPEANTKVVPADGKFILPGFIDGHVHYQGWAAPLYLSNGVTSIIDTANVTAWILAQKWAVSRGLIHGPRIFTCGGQIDGPPGTFDWAILVSTEKEAKDAVRDLVHKGVDCIKIYSMLPKNLMKVVIEEAHAEGVPVRGHITISAVEAAQLGMDGLEHLSGVPIAMIDDPAKVQEIERRRAEPDYLVSHGSLSELAHFMRPELYDQIVRLLVENKIFITPTFIGYWEGILPYRAEYEEYDRAFVNSPKNSFIPEWVREGIVMRFPRWVPVMSDPIFQAGYEKEQKFIKSFVDAGGKIVAGSDASLMTDMHGVDFHRELELLVDAGLSPMEVLQAGTRNAAEMIGKGEDLGTIEAGKLADVLIIKGDPLQDIRNTRKIDTVMKGGKPLDVDYDSSFFDAIPRPLSQDQKERYEARQFKK